LRERRRVMEGIEVRWGRGEDVGCVGDLLEFDGFPREDALRERFVVADDGLRIVGAARVRATPSRMDLRGFVCDPRVREREVAERLYRGARRLASELGISEVWADDERHRESLIAAGYRRRIGGWKFAGETGEPASLFGRLGI
jgi:N-acetylglutamate synthase-like GNAT family acetyltransferase